MAGFSNIIQAIMLDTENCWKRIDSLQYPIEKNEFYSADYSWLIYKDSAIRLLLGDALNNVPRLEILGNRFGLLSLSNIFLWLAEGDDFEYLSISGLPFAQVSSSLAFYLHLDLHYPQLVSEHLIFNQIEFCNSCQKHFSKYQGMIRRLDKHFQFQWELIPESLEECAIGIHSVATNWASPYFRVNTSLTSECELRFSLE